MYFICDVTRTLGEAVPCPGSIYEALVYFLRIYPGVSSACVYRDCSRFGRSSDLQFICFLDSKKLKKFKGSNCHRHRRNDVE